MWFIAIIVHINSHIMLHYSQPYKKSFDRAGQNDCLEIKIHKKHLYLCRHAFDAFLVALCVVFDSRACSVEIQE